jgi:hypothetical protein
MGLYIINQKSQNVIAHIPVLPFRKYIRYKKNPGQNLDPVFPRKFKTLSTQLQTNCHNPTNNPKQLKTTFVGVVILSVRINHHHHAGFITFKAVLGNIGS